MSFCVNGFLSAFRCIRTFMQLTDKKRGGGICLTAQSVIDPLIQGSVCDDEGLDSPRKEKYKYIQSKRV